jgi:hypothetical protein
VNYGVYGNFNPTADLVSKTKFVWGFVHDENDEGPFYEPANAEITTDQSGIKGTATVKMPRKFGKDILLIGIRIDVDNATTHFGLKASQFNGKPCNEILDPIGDLFAEFKEAMGDTPMNEIEVD